MLPEGEVSGVLKSAWASAQMRPVRSPDCGARDPRNGAYGDGVVPSQEDGKEPFGDYGCGPLGDLLAHALYGGEVLDFFARIDHLGDGHPGVPKVGYPVVEVLERVLDTGVAYGAGSHVHAPTVLAEVHGHAEEADRLALVFKQRWYLPNVVGRPPPRSARQASS